LNNPCILYQYFAAIYFKVVLNWGGKGINCTGHSVTICVIPSHLVNVKFGKEISFQSRHYSTKNKAEMFDLVDWQTLVLYQCQVHRFFGAKVSNLEFGCNQGHSVTQNKWIAKKVWIYNWYYFFHHKYAQGPLVWCS